MEERKHRHRRYHSFFERAVYSILLVGAVLLIGTLGFHYIEHYSYSDSFYFVSMLATAEGPAQTPTTVLGKVFASGIAFFSIGTVIFAAAYLLGPFLGRLTKMGEEKFKEDELAFKKDAKKMDRDAKRLDKKL